MKVISCLLICQKSVIIMAGERVGTLELATIDNYYYNESASIAGNVIRWPFTII